MTDIEYIASRHTEGDLLCQLAEEAAELAHAALKLRRAITQNNPTPVTAADAKAALIEEIADVEVAFEVLRHKIGITCDDVFAVEDAKIERWKGRVMLAVGGGTVTESGMCYGTQRKERLGMHVTYVTDDELTVTYFRLGEVYVRAGDRVDDGQPLGKASWQEDARVEVRRNGRRIDVCRWLGMGGIT